MKPPGAKNRRRLQRALERRDGLICFYCRKGLVWPRSLGESDVQPDLDPRPLATIDHLKPLSRGGTNEVKNMIIACRPCHRERHGQ